MAGFIVSMLLLIGLEQTIESLWKKNWDNLVICVSTLVYLAGGFMRSFSVNNYFPADFSVQAQVFGMLLVGIYFLARYIAKKITIQFSKLSSKNLQHTEVVIHPTLDIL